MGVEVRSLTVFTSYKLQALTFDGVATTFQLRTVSGFPPNIMASSDLLVSLDGVIQEPDASYSASGTAIVFMTAPAPDSKCFIVWWSH